MRLSSKALVAGLAIAFGLMATPQHSFSGEQQGKHSPPAVSMQAPRMHEHSCLKGLQLNDEQKKELRRIRQSHKAEMSNLKSQRNEKLSALKSAMRGGDEQAVRKAFQDLSKVKEDMLVLRMSMFNEIRKILNNDQRAQFDACIQQRFDKSNRRGEVRPMHFPDE